MKKPTLLQKIGILTLIGLPIVFGMGFKYPKNSQNLESRIPIGMSIAEAKIPNPKGYPVPSFEGYHFVREIDFNVSDKILGDETKLAYWKDNEGRFILVYKFREEIYAYAYGKEDGSEGGAIVAEESQEVYNNLYGLHEKFDIPKRLIN